MNLHQLTKNLLCGAFALACAGTASANLVSNGDFENPSYAIGSNPHDLGVGNGTLIGWTIGGGGGVNVNHTGASLPYWPTNPSQWLDLTGSTGGAYIEQSFATTMGATYVVSLDTFNGSLSYSGGGPQLHGFDISATGNATMPVLVTPGTGTSVFYSFTATGLSTTLRLSDATGFDSNAGWIDNVVVNSVPDGGMTAALLGMSLTGLALIRRKLA